MPTPDFSKIWASNSPLPAYTFSDADYLTGWDFVGSAPPTKNEFDAWFRMVDEKLNYLYGQLQSTASKLYPIGSVYISFNSADPSTLFGGTWQRLKDTFLLVNGDSYAPNTTGGSATKTIAVSNMPSHNHSVNSSGSHTHTATTSSNGSHSHTINSAGTHNHWTMTDIHTASFDRQAPDVNVDYTDIYYGDDGRWNGNWRNAVTSNAGNHTHTVNNNGSHTHTVSVASNGSHAHTTNNTGGSVPLNIMPPYTTVYAWRRTA